MWRIPVVALMLLVVGATCDEQPCDQYVDYMCECHENDPGFDCEELSLVLSDADVDLQDQCEIDLAEQEADDADAGLECEVGDTGG
ncbi:MAG: hypothetical protein JRJ84_18025 [Deltaproteobacteria bacterium]|nr:hypothetical protein [Deltaproteobacteria bacterium]